MRVAAFVLLSALAGTSAPPARRASRHIKVPVWVGETAVRSLTAEDLTAHLDGAPSRVLAVDGPAHNLIVMVVLDLTGDVAYAAPAKEALIGGLRKLPPHAWVAVLRAQDGLKVLLDPTGERDAATDVIRDQPVSGKAGLLDTVETAARVADAVLAKTSVRLAVLYVTDSEVSNYREDFTNPVINSSDQHDLSRRFPEALVKEKISKVQAALAGRQAPLFIVHVRRAAGRIDEAYQNGLKQLAEVTGGAASFCRSDTEIPGAVARTLDSISSYHSVTLALPERPARDVQVELLHGSGHGLSYRQRFTILPETGRKAR